MEFFQFIAVLTGIACDFALCCLCCVLLQEYRSGVFHEEKDEEFRRMQAKAEAFDEMMKAQKKGEDPFALEDDDVEN